MRARPRILNHLPGFPLAPSHHSNVRLNEIIGVVLCWHHSCLAIQGPPGSGKTYTAKHIIAELVKRGKKLALHRTVIKPSIIYYLGSLSIARTQR